MSYHSYLELTSPLTIKFELPNNIEIPPLRHQLILMLFAQRRWIDEWFRYEFKRRSLYTEWFLLRVVCPSASAPKPEKLMLH